LFDKSLWHLKSASSAVPHEKFLSLKSDKLIICRLVKMLRFFFKSSDADAKECDKPKGAGDGR
jgi:hypothetical protein